MQYPFILKFSSINNLSDARYAAGMWADIAGFCFDPAGPAYTEPGKAAEIKGWINGPLLCGEFGHQPPEWISEFVEKLGLQCVQIPSDYQWKTDFGSDVKLLLQVLVPGETKLFDKADMFICSEMEIYRSLLSYGKPVLLETGNLNTDASELEGIALKGEREDKPGTRNQTAWTEFLEKWAGD